MNSTDNDYWKMVGTTLKSGLSNSVSEIVAREAQEELRRKNQEAWSWIKANDPVLAKMLLDAKDFMKRGDKMIKSVVVIFD